jgi:hypothetical protein
MKNNNQTLEKTGDKQVARPLKELVRLIKSDLQQVQGIEDEELQKEMEVHESFEATKQKWRISIGEKLLEAKSSPQMKHGDFIAWVSRNFPTLHRSQAKEYMGMVKHQKASGEAISGPQHYRRLTRKSYRKNPTGTAKWRNHIQARLDAFEASKFNIELEESNREKEQKLVNDLALEIISIGYKVLATKMHPDKGGSVEAMQRLNDARDRLKEVVR